MGDWCFHEASVMIGEGCGTVGAGTRMAHRRSLGFARDDKKTAMVRKKWLLNRDIFNLSSDVPTGLTLPAVGVAGPGPLKNLATNLIGIVIYFAFGTANAHGIQN